MHVTLPSISPGQQNLLFFSHKCWTVLCSVGKLNWLTLPPYQKNARARIRVEGSTFLAGEKEMENKNVFLLAKAERELTDPGCNSAGSPALFFISGTVRKR